jgi:CheY-like chemotaxis protein
MTGLLLDTDLTAPQREYAETVRQSGESLLRLINEILDFSKIEAGKLDTESYPFDLCQIIEEVHDLLAAGASHKNIDLLLEYPAETPRKFVGDGAKIRQVVTNLVGNAIKFTSNGHILVSVDGGSRDAVNPRMRVAVRDTGMGIAPEKIGLLFEKFSQVDGSSTRKFGGTGLGLAISKQLVNLMKGSIGVDSREGEGSTFWFELPLRQDPLARSAEPAPARLAGLRVLILAGNEVNRRVRQRQITDWGMRAGSFAAGDEAMRALRAAAAAGEPYHCAFLDGSAAGGIGFARAIRSDPLLRQCAIVMSSSLAQSHEFSRLESGVIDACLSKPVRQSQLFDTLASVLAKRQGLEVSGSLEFEKKPAGPGQADSQRFAARNRRILVVEDNPVNQKVACRLLEKLGLRVDVAANGREAVAMSALASYGLILMDCQMPEMDGYEATREIRRREETGPRVAVIAMTADAMAGSRERCLEAGMDDYISKPVQADQLYLALERWLAPLPQAIPVQRI